MIGIILVAALLMSGRLMVDVVQSVERQIVVLVVAGSSPVIHPRQQVFHDPMVDQQVRLSYRTCAVGPGGPARMRP